MQVSWAFFCLSLAFMRIHDLIEPATALAYRLSAYVLLNWGDDAAMLALMFC